MSQNLKQLTLLTGIVTDIADGNNRCELSDIWGRFRLCIASCQHQNRDRRP